MHDRRYHDAGGATFTPILDPDSAILDPTRFVRAEFFAQVALSLHPYRAPNPDFANATPRQLGPYLNPGGASRLQN
jgi:hypothetical protein